MNKKFLQIVGFSALILVGLQTQTLIGRDVDIYVKKDFAREEMPTHMYIEVWTQTLRPQKFHMPENLGEGDSSKVADFQGILDASHLYFYTDRADSPDGLPSKCSLSLERTNPESRITVIFDSPHECRAVQGDAE